MKTIDCKKIEQTEENKNKYDSPLINILIGTEKVTREDLCEKLHCSDREVRALVAELSMFYPVISNSNEKGYMLPKMPSECNMVELKENIEMIEHTLAEHEARVKVLHKKMKPLIAYLSIARGLYAESETNGTEKA